MPTIDETWTLSSSCVSPIECEGTATSSAGWTARLWYGYPNVYWVVDRTFPIGSSAPAAGPLPASRGFSSGDSTRWPRNAKTKITNFLVGRQRTISPSGSCGTNQPLVIETPMKLEQLS